MEYKIWKCEMKLYVYGSRFGWCVVCEVKFVVSDWNFVVIRWKYYKVIFD